MKPLQVGLILLALAALGGLALLVNQAVKQNPPRQARLAIESTDTKPDWVELRVFTDLFDPSRTKFSTALAEIEDHWRPGYGVMLFETMRMLDDAEKGEKIISVVAKKTRQNIDSQKLVLWSRYLLQNLTELPDYYPAFKSFAHAQKFAELGVYFENDPATEIRLDEIIWGGVNRDGIPPLRNPKMISAADAIYLDDSNVIFGIDINGDARAYPKRILAWHEMFTDTIGDESVNGVYCTLCGAMIVYATIVDGTHHELGTSGFLYRSNKLMYDEQTKSLWSTLGGRPVVGTLVGKNIQLPPVQVVTTTWGEWRKRHPETTVLSLDTGFFRNYAEGEAYRSYFATDDLMFPVAELDDRLKNKSEVLAVRLDETTSEKLVISADFLMDHRVYHDSLGGTPFVVLTDDSGANRVFECFKQQFEEIGEGGNVIDNKGQVWSYDEFYLSGPAGEKFKRLPAHRVFWFGWRAAFPDTRLVK